MNKAAYRLKDVSVRRVEDRLVIFGNVQRYSDDEKKEGKEWVTFAHIDRKVGLSVDLVEVIRADLTELARKDFLCRYQPDDVVDQLELLEVLIEDAEEIDDAD